MKTYIVVAVVLVAASVVNAAPILVESTFDVDADGWSGDQPLVSWQSSGGNPSGYLRFGTWDDLDAPSKFLGDWTDKGVTAITYDETVFDFEPGRFYLVADGPGGRALWWGPYLHAGDPWTRVTAPVDESQWEIQSGSWEPLLGNVTTFTVGLYWAGAYYPTFDVGLDNIRLLGGEVVPVPGAVLLGTLGAGLVGWLRRRRTL